LNPVQAGIYPDGAAAPADAGACAASRPSAAGAARVAGRLDS